MSGFPVAFNGGIAKCPECGLYTGVNEIKCSHCSAEFSEEEKKEMEQWVKNQIEKSKKIRAWGVGIIAVLILGAVFYKVYLI